MSLVRGLGQYLGGPLAACFVAISVSGLGACASGDDDKPSDSPAARASDMSEAPPPRNVRDVLVRQRDIESAPSKPAGALLHWWRALQFSDDAGVAGAYAENVETGPIGRQVRKLSTSLANVRPAILETEEDDDRAVVRVVIQSYGFKPRGGPMLSETAQAFSLTRQAGGWKLADNAFLRGRYRDQLAAERSAQETQ